MLSPGKSRWIASVTLLLAPVSYAAVEPAQDDGRHAPAPLPLCPVTGEPVNLVVSTITDEGPVFFCCAACMGKFKADPARFAEQVTVQRKALADRPSVQVTCPVSGEAVDRKVFIEHAGKRVYFCTSDCSEKYRRAPAGFSAALANSYTYQTKCPVMGGTIDPTSFTRLADGGVIYYCCDGCEKPLFETPAKYAGKLAAQGFQFNWAKIKKAADAQTTPSNHGDTHAGHEGHDHP